MNNRKRLNIVVLLSAISSGCLLVLGPYIAAKSNQEYLVPLYFFIYILTNILSNKWLSKSIDFNGGLYFIKLSVKIRIALLFITLFLIHDVNTILLITFISISASLPDAIFRSAYPTYIKRTCIDNELQEANSNYSLYRQIGYIAGTMIGGILIFYQTVSLVAMLLAVGFVSIYFLSGIVIDISSTAEQKIDKSYKENGLFSYLVEKEILGLYTTVLIILVVGFILPMSLAPFVIGYLNYGSMELGLLEASFSIGALIGARYYQNKTTSSVPVLMLLISSLSLGGMYLMSFNILLLNFLLAGCTLQCSIWFFTQLQLNTPQDKIGVVVTNLYFHATLFSALYMSITTIFASDLINISYYTVSFLLFAALVNYICIVRKSPIYTKES
ncbi:hypothetical protein [Aeromonas hydrophila]|uniref:hypothetical protein n=1 Tax=Aeromonas hydrophila TaxID=644 RepID=UPI002B46E155|nr:hypothetical protein [Aeromonas hydrophila]